MFQPHAARRPTSRNRENATGCCRLYTRESHVTVRPCATGTCSVNNSPQSNVTPVCMCNKVAALIQKKTHWKRRVSLLSQCIQKYREYFRYTHRIYRQQTSLSPPEKENQWRIQSGDEGMIHPPPAYSTFCL